MGSRREKGLNPGGSFPTFGSLTANDPTHTAEGRPTFPRLDGVAPCLPPVWRGPGLLEGGGEAVGEHRPVRVHKHRRPAPLPSGGGLPRADPTTPIEEGSSAVIGGHGRDKPKGGRLTPTTTGTGERKGRGKDNGHTTGRGSDYRRHGGGEGMGGGRRGPGRDVDLEGLLGQQIAVLEPRVAHRVVRLELACGGKGGRLGPRVKPAAGYDQIRTTRLGVSAPGTSNS